MNDYLQLAFVVVLSISVGFQLGHLVTSFQYETNDRYNKRSQSDDKIDEIKNVE